MPPAAVTVAEPVAAPFHETLVCELTLALNASAGSVTVTLAVVVQDLESVTVTV